MKNTTKWKKVFSIATIIIFCLLFCTTSGWSLQKEEAIETEIKPYWTEHKTYFVDTRLNPSRKVLSLTLTVSELTTNNKRCTGNVRVFYTIDEGTPYSDTFIVKGCETIKVKSTGMVRYLYLRITNDSDSPVTLKAKILYEWTDK